ncbi:hypothetical protein DYB26_016021, partial [Aphanomyces astaci]
MKVIYFVRVMGDVVVRTRDGKANVRANVEHGDVDGSKPALNVLHEILYIGFITTVNAKALCVVSRLTDGLDELLHLDAISTNTAHQEAVGGKCPSDRCAGDIIMDVEKKVIVQDEEIEDDEEEDEVVEGSAAAEGGDAAAKKKNKKKNKKKKKKAAATAAGPGTKLPPFRGVTGFTDSYIQYGQTEPPTIPVAKLFAVGSFPKGEEQNHPGDFNTYRITSEELRAAERENEAFYDRVRYASEVHRQVRKFAQGLIKPGIRLIDLCEALENKNRELVEEAGFA